MKVSRRSFLLGAAATMTVPERAVATPPVLRAEPVTMQVLPEGREKTALWGFNGSSPGPELRVRQGETLALRFENAIAQDSSIHWHGIRLPNGMDGVPGLTQPPIPSGKAFDYVFQTPDAGTFWYHSHQRSWEQVARGLYGPLIVEERDPPPVNADITVMLDDWRLDQSGALAADFGNMHDFAHAGRLGNFARIMSSRPQVRMGDRVRLRLINVATARIFPIRIEGLEGKEVAVDGMPLAVPRALSDLSLAPAQRVDLIGDVMAPVTFRLVTPDGLYDMGALTAEGTNPEPLADDVTALARPDIGAPKAIPDRSLVLGMEGGAMGGHHSGADIWSFNGVSGSGGSGLPKAPFATFRRGETGIIELINDTGFPHGMHLHGHHFHELAEDGSPGDLRDTSLVERNRSRKIAMVFDNPGRWLFHCHMLGHQATGMKTWIEVL